ncbi:MAG: hypothetical protein ACR2MA_11630 [Egibacteraceae bacterium]
MPRWVVPAALTVCAVGLLGVLGSLGGNTSPDSGAREVAGVLAVMVTVVGAAGLAPALVQGLGRMADYMPPASRLALRASARQRARSSAAVGALVVVLVVPVTALTLMSRPDWWGEAQQGSDLAIVSGPSVVGLRPPPEPQDAAYARTLLPSAEETAELVWLGPPDAADPDVIRVSSSGGLTLEESAALLTPELLDVLDLPASLATSDTAVFIEGGQLQDESVMPGEGEPVGVPPGAATARRSGRPPLPIRGRGGRRSPAQRPPAAARAVSRGASRCPRGGESCRARSAPTTDGRRVRRAR